jgi:hypothetical protein
MTTVKTSGVNRKNTGLSPALLGWWKLDEGSGIVLNDASANGNHMTAPQALSTGFWGTAGRGTFNGSTDRFNLLSAKFTQLAQLARFEGSNAPSLMYSLRMKAAVPAGDSVLVGNKGRTGNQDGTCLTLKSSGNIEFSYAPSGAAASKFQTTTTNPADETDVHFVAALSRSDDKLYFYKNGVKLNEFTLSTNYPDASTLYTEDPGLSIGTRGFNNVTAPFNGQLWDVQIYLTFQALPLSTVTLAANLTEFQALTIAQLP